jgi:peptidoglycan/LPS O-acetylase OafA/YrhL
MAFEMTKRHNQYRPDIDGLRALAIIVVVGFHAFPSIVPGGFVGVDVFFVISGYLISGIVLEKLSRGTFSYHEFYYRRIKRIFPALIVVLIGSYLMGLFSLLVEELKYLGSHIVSGALFISNFKSWYEAGYFDSAADTKPLLHLWSLAVEEQFYIAWPFLLWLFHRRNFNFWLLIGLVAVPSFLFNIVEVHYDHLAAAFYSPMSRFWELMLGAMIAGAGRSKLAISPMLRECQSIVGLLAICLAVAIINSDGSFPGWWALLPTVGTALTIAAGPYAWLNRAVLSNRALVGIGLISYPLYLWHWPLLSFARIVQGETPPLVDRVTAVAMSVALAWATYQLVEKPIRFRTHNAFRTCAALSALLLAVGLFGLVTRMGFRFAVEEPLVALNQGETVAENGNDVFFHFMQSHFYPCTPDYIQKHSSDLLYWPARCLQSKPSEIKDVAIIGDSHAEDLFVGLAERLKDTNIVTYIRDSLPARSNKEYKEILDYVVKDRNIHSIILTSLWDVRKKNVPSGSSLENELTTTVDELIRSGKAVYLVTDRPGFPFEPTVCKYWRARLFWQARGKPRCDFDRSRFNLQQEEYDKTLVAVAKKFSNVHLLDSADVFCDETLCHMADSGLLLFRDVNHLTLAGSRAVASRWIGQFPIEGATSMDKSPSR